MAEGIAPPLASGGVGDRCNTTIPSPQTNAGALEFITPPPLPLN